MGHGGKLVITKLIAIKNVGKFRSSAATPNPQLKPVTLISGANGYGKTTLCSVLRSLATNEPALINGRRTLGGGEPEIEILTDNGVARFQNGSWKGPQLGIEIYDGLYVSENVHAGEVVDLEQKRNFYNVVIGREGVALAQQDAALAKESRDLNASLMALQGKFEPFLANGMTIDAFKKLAANPEIEEKIAQQRKVLKAAQEASMLTGRAGIRLIPDIAVPLRLSSVLQTSLQDIEDSSLAKVEERVKTFVGVDGAKWINVGLQQIEDERCPFCLQSLSGVDIINSYRAVFGDKLRSHIDEIEQIESWARIGLGDSALEKITASIEAAQTQIDFWSSYCRLNGGKADLPAGWREIVKSARDALLILLEEKKAKPHLAVSEGSIASALAPLEALSSEIAAVNSRLTQDNEEIERCKAQIAGADVAKERAALAALEAVRVRHTPDCAALCEDHNDLISAREALDAERENVRNQLNRHTRQVVEPYEKRINELLGKFNAGFSISKTSHAFPGGRATSSYRIKINDSEVDLGGPNTPSSSPSFRNTLSSGDKSTLALAFFIADLERNPDLSNQIVVFDDPFNSQDSFRMRQTMFEIRRLSQSCKQVLVLSHDPIFLKSIWDRTPSANRVALGITDHRADGSKISEIDIEAVCESRTSTEVADLQAFATEGAGDPVDIVKKMRVVLESYFRQAYPALFPGQVWLGDIVAAIRNGGPGHPAAALYSEIDEINDYTAPFHHGETASEQSIGPIDATELQGFVRRTLRVVNA